jgi:hypothetical protein
MKRLFLGGGVALAALLVSVPEASAWWRVRFGVGFNFGFDIGGWGLCRGCHGQPVDGGVISEGYPWYAGAAGASQYPSYYASAWYGSGYGGGQGFQYYGSQPYGPQPSGTQVPVTDRQPPARTTPDASSYYYPATWYGQTSYLPTSYYNGYYNAPSYWGR